MARFLKLVLLAFVAYMWLAGTIEFPGIDQNGEDLSNLL